MMIGGLQKNSLIDYPGKISCVIFLSGCNFDCPYCHNPQLVKIDKQTPSIGENHIYMFLQNRKGFLDGVVISGGEPTIQPGLISMCKKIKQMGYPVKLDTNGSRPEVIRWLIEEDLIDYIAMDVKTDPERYPRYIQRDCNAETIRSSIRIIMDSRISHEFKTTCIRPIVDAGVIGTISGLIQGAMLYAIQRSNLSRVLHPEFFKDGSATFDDDELSRFKSIADKWVKRCIIR